jgi:hypothetical protein
MKILPPCKEFVVRRFIFGIFSIFLFYSCVSVEQRTPRISPPETIEKSDRDSVEQRTSLISLSEAIERSARDIENALDANTKIAVVNIAFPSEAFALYVMEELTNSFVNGKKLIVAERRDLDIIRNELAFQYSGDVSDESMQSIGRMLGAQTIISGSIIEIDNVYRFRVNAINVETAVRVASSSLNFRNDAQIESLKNSRLAANDNHLSNEYVNENINIEVLQDGERIIPRLVSRKDTMHGMDLGEIPLFTINNKNFSIILPDAGNVFISASISGGFFRMDEYGQYPLYTNFNSDDYPIIAYLTECFGEGKGFDGHNTAYNNQLYINYLFEGYQWYGSGEKMQINSINVIDDLAKNEFEEGADNIYIAFWINKNKDYYIDEDEILVIGIEIRGRGTLLR